MSKKELKENEYQCANCHNIYEKGWTDEEAQKEAESNFPGFPKQAMAVICDDCYNIMMGINADQPA